MPIVQFFSDNQKTNSTHTPITIVAAGDCLFKQPTDLFNPTIIYNGNCESATQFALMGKFYWVTNMVSVRNGVWEVTGKINVLATYKTAIGNSSGFISYADTENNYVIPDTRLPVEAGSNIINTNEQLLNWIDEYSNYYCVGITCIDHNEVNVVTRGELYSLLSPYSGATPTQIQKALGAGEVTCLNSITSCIWFPLNLTTMGAIDFPGGNIKFGTDLDSGVTRRRLAGSIWRSPEISISLGLSFVDWRAVNASVELLLPFYGSLTIPGTSLINNSGNETVSMDSTIFAKYYINLRTGEYTIEIYRKVTSGSHRLSIAVVSGSLGVQIPIGAVVDLAANKMLGSMSNLVSNVFKGQWGSALGNTAEAYGVLTHTVNTSQPITVSAGGGGSPYVFPTIKSTTYFNPVSVPNPNDASIKATIGVPVGKVDTISNIISTGTGSGFVQGNDLKISASITEAEKNEIESYFRSGFFYEA